MSGFAMPPKKLGAWTADGVHVVNTVYQAPSDGFVFGYAGNSGATVEVKIDSTDPPAVVRFRNYAGQLNYGSVAGAVKKGDYWSVIVSAGTGGYIYWLPLE